MQNISIDSIKSRLASSSPRQTLTIPEYRHAAVLMPFVISPSSLDLLFTVRTHAVETHKGQISFPGGVVDGGDRDSVHTALREAQEEIGLDHSLVDVIGILDDMPTPTGFVITPVVGTIGTMPSLTLNPDEVAEVFSVPVSFFADKRNGRTEVRELRGKHREIWFYDYGDKIIWGATAMMIRSLLTKLDLAPQMPSL